MRITVLDVSGRRVAELVDGVRPAGTGLAVWDGRDDGGRRVDAGVYFARLSFAGRSVTKRLVLLR